MARLFDGTGDYAKSASQSYYNGATVTVAFWMRVPSGHGNSLFDYALGVGGDILNRGLTFNFSGSGASIDALVWHGGGSFQVGTSFTFTDDVWTHYCITSTTTGPSTKFYTSGSLQGSANTTDTRVTGAVPFAICAEPNDPANAQGEASIEELVIFSSILDAAQVAGLAKRFSPEQVSPSTIEGYWRLLGRNDPEVDRAKNGQHLTITGSGGRLEHLPMTYPASPHVVTAPAAAAPAGLKGGLALMGVGV